MTLQVTAFVKYDRMAASTRQRLLQFVPALNAAGIELDYRPLLNNDYVASLGGGTAYPWGRIAGSYARRLTDVAFKALGDVVWVYAELFPWLPALFERLLIHRNRPLICDMDDAFFSTYDQHQSAVIRRLLQGKLEPLLSAAAACTCGNAYLREYAGRFCANSIIIPTVVDTDIYQPAGRGASPVPVIGWIGSPSTWRYMHPLIPLMKELIRAGRARVRVIGAGSCARDYIGTGVEFLDWSEDGEVAELQNIDIGIMPLPDEPWARGKSGYKLIQYMACGLPVVASPVGVNSEIVQDGANGYLAQTDAEWREAIDSLLLDARLRMQFGRSGRERAVADYSVKTHAPRLIEIIRSAAPGSSIPGSERS